MSAKPTIALSRWGDQIGANLVAPTSGERDLGFQAGTPASAGKVNYEINQLYQWALWLSDGDCAFHNLSATGTLQATGATTLNSGLTVPTGQAVNLNGTTTLTVGGALSANGNLSVSGSTTVGNLTIGNVVSGLSVFDQSSIGGQSISFSPRTFTADSTTDRIALTGHGRSQGDGPFRVSNSGGALPGGLASATDYWISSVIDADHFLVATSFVGAMNGIFVDITTNGTGTQTITSNFAIHPANLTVDGKVTANHFAGESQTWRFGVSNAVILASGASIVVNGTSSMPSITLGTTSGSSILPITTIEYAIPGKLITGWGVRLSKTSSGTISAKLHRVDQTINTFATAAPQIGSTQSFTGSDGGANTDLHESGLSIAYLSDRTYFIELIGSGTTGDSVIGWYFVVTT